jgi:hypothetical protein
MVLPTFFWIRDYAIGKGELINSTVLSQYSSFMEMVIAFWGLLLNLILVAIAYKAFKNYDVKKEFHSGQLNVMSELANSLGRSEIANMLYETKISPQNTKHKISTGFTFPFLQIMLGYDYEKFEKFYIKGNNIEIAMPFLKFRSHPLLPKKIAELLWGLYAPLQYQLAVQNSELPENYVVFYGKTPEDDVSKEWLFLYSENPKEHIKNITELRDSIRSWFKDYGAEESNL